MTILPRAVGAVLALALLVAASSSEVRRMAEASDAEGLRAVEEIDGVAVDMNSLLADRGEYRIGVIAGLESEAVDAGRVAMQAETILSNPKYASYEPSWLERFAGPLHRWSQRILGFGTDVFRSVVAALAAWISTRQARWIGIPLLVVGTAFGTWILGRRRAKEVERRAVIERILELGLDPEEIEGHAEEARKRGDFAEEIRLRFVAGLLRLDALGVIEFYPGLSNGSISTMVDSAQFDRLAEQFDAAVYGRHPVSATDADAAMAGWLEVVGVKR